MGAATLRRPRRARQNAPVPPSTWSATRWTPAGRRSTCANIDVKAQAAAELGQILPRAVGFGAAGRPRSRQSRTVSAADALSSRRTPPTDAAAVCLRDASSVFEPHARRLEAAGHP